MPEITADTGAFDRMTVDRTPNGARYSWRIEIHRPADARHRATKEHMDVTRDELVALYDHLAEVLS